MNHKAAKVQAKELAAHAIDDLKDTLHELGFTDPPIDPIVWLEPPLTHLLYLFLISQESPTKEAHQKA